MSGSGKETFQEKLILLRDLNRPLEEHWSVKNNSGLDARNSDYIYKHHLTRLEDIYVRHKLIIDPPPKMLAMTPVSQLYGIKGLETQVPGFKKRMKRREDKWVQNFQKYKALSPTKDQEKDKTARNSFNKSSSVPLLLPNGALRNDNINFPGAHDVNEEDEDDDPIKSRIIADTRRVNSNRLSKEEVTMLGMYQLNSEQQEIYDNFVNMIKSFEHFDMCNIVEDAFSEAQSDYLLETNYSGIEAINYGFHPQEQP